MSNPRPCALCHLPERSHHFPGPRNGYVPAERTEPLRARRTVVSASGYMPESHRGNYRWEPTAPLIDPRTLREFLDAEIEDARTAVPTRSSVYYSGRISALADVRAKFG